MCLQTETNEMNIQYPNIGKVLMPTQETSSILTQFLIKSPKLLFKSTSNAASQFNDLQYFRVVRNQCNYQMINSLIIFHILVIDSKELPIQVLIKVQMDRAI